uniref:Uncharacterized protein n=1 Tax=Spongospora subterranea TaxID=70186 RepID=A0A0H5QV27_9EUKA|eukprot:CRZ05833.1 hypothetical protein [Spongospora subterranea]
MDKSQTSLAVTTCLDPECKNSQVEFPYQLGGGFYHSYGSTDIVFGRENKSAVISFQQWNMNGTQGILQLCVCGHGTCESPQIVTIDSSAAEYTSIAVDKDGDIMVVFTDESYSALRLAVCKAPITSSSNCTVTTLLSTSETILWPVIRTSSPDLLVGAGLPVIAYFQAWSGGIGGSLIVFQCSSPRCTNENPIDAVVVDYNPRWVVSEMQISMVLRQRDGRPVIAYSVYEAPSLFYLRIAVCHSKSCEQSSTYDVDDFKDVTQLTIKFDGQCFLIALLFSIALCVIVLGSALYSPNKARLVNVYTMSPFTRDIIIDANYRKAIGLGVLFTVAGAFLSSFSWLLYCGSSEFFSYWHIFLLSLISIVTSASSYFAIIQCSRRNLIIVGAAVLFTLLFDLTLILTYSLNSFKFECGTINVSVPRFLSVIGVFIVGCVHLLDLFLFARIYLALGLASPTLMHNQWEDDI